MDNKKNSQERELYIKINIDTIEAMEKLTELINTLERALQLNAKLES